MCQSVHHRQRQVKNSGHLDLDSRIQMQRGCVMSAMKVPKIVGSGLQWGLAVLQGFGNFWWFVKVSDDLWWYAGFI